MLAAARSPSAPTTRPVTGRVYSAPEHLVSLPCGSFFLYVIDVPSNAVKQVTAVFNVYCQWVKALSPSGSWREKREI